MDVVGQFPQLKTYNQGVLIFRLGVDVSRDDVVVALRDALAQIISRVPWLGECVIHEVQNDGISTLCKTVPFPPTVHDKGMLIVKDCSDVCPSYEELYHRGAPVSLLDGKVLCPLPGFPLSYDETDVAHAPILVLQVSFIKGGLLLNFSNQHNMVDGVGVFAFLTCLSIAMRGKEIPQNLIDHANIDGGNVIPLLDPRQPMRDHSHLLRSSNTIKVPQLPSPTPNSRWALFRVLRKNIPAIKLSATNKEEFVESVKYISTNDALCAFYWKRLAAVRVANRSVDSGSRSKFLRAIDARSAVGAPLGYIGQMVYHAATFFTYHELASPELTLSIIASRMRADLNESNTEWSVRSYATFLAGVSDKSTLVYGGGFNPMLDIGNSSMAQLDFTGLDFGILGKPEFLRRPNLSPAPGVMYVFGPEGPDRDLPVLVCLSDSDIDGLKADNEWGHVTEYVG
ncbi:transferase family-domain-containing protein [Ustulina deusta]|nr:transferase family-domain-containing protein [Ustulina deusta]